MPTCRDCALWDIDGAKDKAGRVRHHWGIRCMWESKEPWPMSARGSRPFVANMNASGGHGCPCFVQREKK